MALIVGIDGPAGSGKGTVTKRIAQKLNLINIDTGITYRCVALKALRKKLNLKKDEKEIIEISKKLNLKIVNNIDRDEVFLDNENVTDEIRSKEVSNIVSPISSIKEIRIEMIKLQRELAENKDVIVEGRDICTEVFPNADIKIYLDASIETRASRRHKEYIEKGIDISYDEVLESIKKRDYNDINKPMGALKITKDSIIIDTSNLSIDEVTDKIINIIKEKRGF